MKNNFNDCLQHVLKDEGGYTNDPSDSGGATNYGITIFDYRKYINSNGTPADVKKMTVAQASEIYKDKYWNALNCDALPSGVDYTCFDYGVHSGLGRPQKALQKFSKLSGDKLIDAINDERTAFLHNLVASRPKDAKFEKGWLGRVSRVRAYSHVLAAKKDTVTGPSAGVAASLGVFATLMQYLHLHPAIAVAIAIGAGLSIWAFVHWLRNRNV